MKKVQKESKKAEQDRQKEEKRIIKENKIKEQDRLKEEKRIIKEEKVKLKQEEERLKEEKRIENQGYNNKLEIEEYIKDLNCQKRETKIEIEYKIIKDETTIIEKIIHIADIHIRLLERHNEYNKVFNKFYKELEEIKRENPNTIVCLCGDLLEKKDNLKAEI